MKTKKLTKKLIFNRQTIASIGNDSMKKAIGGATFEDCFSIFFTNCDECYTFVTIKCTEPCCETRP